jgi:hypothetical protein
MQVPWRCVRPRRSLVQSRSAIAISQLAFSRVASVSGHVVLVAKDPTTGRVEIAGSRVRFRPAVPQPDQAVDRASWGVGASNEAASLSRFGERGRALHSHRRGARDLQLREQVRISRTDDLLLDDAVVIGAPRATGHPTMQTTVGPISIGEETVAEKANDLTVCKCRAWIALGCRPITRPRRSRCSQPRGVTRIGEGDHFGGAHAG